MSRHMLVATGIFYILVGALLFFAPVSHHAISVLIANYLLNTRFALDFYGLALATIGIATLYCSWFYNQIRFRILVSGLRAGIMGTLTVLSILSALVLHTGLGGIIFFGYLTVIMVLTIPPPFSLTVQQAINAITAEHEANTVGHTEQGESDDPPC